MCRSWSDGPSMMDISQSPLVSQAKHQLFRWCAPSHCARQRSGTSALYGKEFSVHPIVGKKLNKWHNIHRSLHSCEYLSFYQTIQTVATLMQHYLNNWGWFFHKCSGLVWYQCPRINRWLTCLYRSHNARSIYERLAHAMELLIHETVMNPPPYRQL